MTCIIGYVDRDYIYIGGDSCGAGGNHKSIRKDEKVFRKNKMIFGYTSSFRMGHLLHWKFNIPEHPKNISVDEYMNTIFIDEVIKLFTDNGFCEIDKNQKTGGNFLIAYKNRLFDIQNDFQIAEDSDGISTCGSGYIAAEAAFKALLYNCKKMSTYEKIIKTLEITSEMILGVDPPFKILKIKKEE